MATLALDLGTKSTGFALRLPACGGVRLGHACLRRGTVKGRDPRPAMRLNRRLLAMHDACQLDRVVFEQTFSRGGIPGWLLASLEFAVLQFAVSNQLSWTRVTPGEWKKHATGKGNCGVDVYWRAAVVKWPDEHFACSDMAAARFLLDYVESV